ncbi:MAG: addiction module antidote protein [Pseudomonadota bacterium]
MAGNTTPYDPSHFLIDSARRAEYLKAALAESEGDPRFVLVALGHIARSVGMTELADRTGMTRQGLHASLSETGNPKWETVWRIADELGLEVTFRAKASGE